VATKPILAPLELAVTSETRVTRYAILSDYWVLTKPEVNFLIVITTFAGFYLACADGRTGGSFHSGSRSELCWVLCWLPAEREL
jgi:heme O synthase-like polyprenyltransferase